jgi:hypothetical protein
MPPATTTTSQPSASGSGHGLPNGPRTPSVSPGCAPQIAWVTAPTARTVWTTAPSSPMPLIEIGASPTPNA